MAAKRPRPESQFGLQPVKMDVSETPSPLGHLSTSILEKVTYIKKHRLTLEQIEELLSVFVPEAERAEIKKLLRNVKEEGPAADEMYDGDDVYPPTTDHNSPTSSCNLAGTSRAIATLRQQGQSELMCSILDDLLCGQMMLESRLDVLRREDDGGRAQVIRKKASTVAAPPEVDLDNLLVDTQRLPEQHRTSFGVDIYQIVWELLASSQDMPSHRILEHVVGRLIEQVLPPTKLIACCVSPSNRPTKHFNLNLRFIPIASAALSSGFGFPSPQADIRVAVEGMANTLIETNRKKLQRRRSPFTEEELLSYGFTLEQLPRIVPTSFSIQGPPQ